MKFLCYLGIVAVIIGWSAIILSAAFNPWFDVTRNALSDLGAINVENNYIFNAGLAVAGVFAFAYVFCLINSIKSKLTAFAAGIYSLAIIHLILITIFPEGTSPHWFVSIEFFVLTGVSILFFGEALILTGNKKHGSASIIYAVLGFSGSILIEWPSVAILEIFSLILITLWIMTMLHYHIMQ